MTKVLQIRDVPDEVHDALIRAARAQGMSMNRYVLRELEHLALLAQIAEDNQAVIRHTQQEIHAASRDTILAVLKEGRGT